MSFEVFTADDPRWNDVLSRVPHDVYHLPGYACVCATHEPWEVRLATVEHDGEVLIQPFMTRDLPRDARGCDITTPYGYPGPVCSSSDPVVQRALVGELLDGFRDLDAVTVFLRCHPFFGVDLTALEAYGEVVVHGDQVFIDLTDVPERIEDSFRPGHRNEIRMLKNEGFDVRVDEPADMDAFPALYRENMVRLDAAPYYHFPDAYFDAIRRCLAEQAHYVTAASPDGEIAAIALVLICGPIAQYHLSCTNVRFLKKAPSKLSILGMAELSRRLGVKELNLGGGVGGGNDSLLQFKAGFSTCRAPFATARFILDRERYEQLSAGIEAPPGFFPAYRTGL